MSTVHSTLWGDMPADVVVHDRRELGVFGTLRSLLRTAKSGDAVLVNGAIGVDRLWHDLAMALVLRRLKPGVAIVIVDATWTPRSTRSGSRIPALFGMSTWLGKELVRLIGGPRTHICLLSRAECEEYVRDTRVPVERVHFTPYPATLEPDLIPDDVTGPGDGYVFAVGDALRDWDLLREAVGSDLPTRVAARRDSGSWPDNVTVASLDPEQLVEQMARAAVVVIPLDTTTSRSAGQQSYLNAMLLGRPVVVTDAIGVRDYITPAVDGYIVAGRANELRDALRAALTGGADIRAVAARGAETARQHTMTRYWATVTEIGRSATH